MDRNILNIKEHIIFMIFLIIIIASCSEKKTAPYPYMMELNPLRKEIGLRVIDSTFIRYNYISESTFSENRNIYLFNIGLKLKHEYQKLKNKPSFLEKFIFLNKYSGKPIYEEDIYKSGYYKYGHIEETDIFEILKCRYVFEDYNAYDFKTKDSIPIEKGWHYIYEYPNEMLGVTSNKQKSEYWEKKRKEISKMEADSILSSWKLMRLNY